MNPPETSEEKGKQVFGKPEADGNAGSVETQNTLAVELTEAECEQLERLFDKGAAKVEVFDAYWIYGADTGHDYCLDCALIEVAKEKARRRRLSKAEKRNNPEVPGLDGGWRTEHDSPPFCDQCSKRLDGSLTDYGCRAELDHFIEYGFHPNSADDCYSMSELIAARGWRPWSQRVYSCDYERERDERYFRDLWELGKRILSEHPNEPYVKGGSEKV